MCPCVLYVMFVWFTSVFVCLCCVCLTFCVASYSLVVGIVWFVCYALNQIPQGCLFLIVLHCLVLCSFGLHHLVLCVTCVVVFYVIVMICLFDCVDACR